MIQRSLAQRLFSIEAIVGALIGALMPFLVALAIQVAPARVPLWLVALSIGFGILLTWVARAVWSTREKNRAIQERKDREQLALKTEVEELKEEVASISASRRSWLRRRNPWL
jgi:hypothetical protein